MSQLRHSALSLPRHLAGRPVFAGYKVPFFVAEVDGEPDFRIADARKVDACLRHDLCWVCGTVLGRHKLFTVGPMCLANRISSEPPMHRDCAEYSVQVCPHISHAKARRREAKLPSNHREPPGHMVRENPGLVVIVETADWMPRRVDDGWLIDLGERLLNVDWWTEGRRATRAEAEQALLAGVNRVKADMLARLSGSEQERAMYEMGVSAEEAARYLPAD